MNLPNDLNIPPDPVETWQVKVGRLVREVFLPYAVPYVIPAILSWKLTRGLQADPDERVVALQDEVGRLKQRVSGYQGLATKTQRHEYQTLQQINRGLDSMAQLLEERQDIYCSRFKPKEGRKNVEKRLRELAVEHPHAVDLKLYKGIEEILEHDTHCGNSREENGCLMWVYMDLWRTRARLRMQENVQMKTRAYDWKL